MDAKCISPELFVSEQPQQQSVVVAIRFLMRVKKSCIEYVGGGGVSSYMSHKLIQMHNFGLLYVKGGKNDSF